MNNTYRFFLSFALVLSVSSFVNLHAQESGKPFAFSAQISLFFGSDARYLTFYDGQEKVLWSTRGGNIHLFNDAGFRDECEQHVDLSRLREVRVRMQTASMWAMIKNILFYVWRGRQYPTTRIYYDVYEVSRDAQDNFVFEDMNGKRKRKSLTGCK